MHARAKITAKVPGAKRENPVFKIGRRDLSQSIRSAGDYVVLLQRTIGNQALQRMLKSCVLQAKL